MTECLALLLNGDYRFVSSLPGAPSWLLGVAGIYSVVIPITRRLAWYDAVVLLSAKVNQWTLLVGSLPVAYAIGGGSAAGLLLDGRQTEEFLLTAAQTAMGFAMLADLRFSVREAAILLVLFAVQFPFAQTPARLAFAAEYALIAAVLLVQRRRELPAIARALRSAS